jgi:DNA-binding LytR/AlgR family response regulator
MNERQNFYEHNGIIRPIDYSNIKSIVVDAYLSTVYREKGSAVSFVKSLDEMLAFLPACFFAQISRDTIININRIKEFDGAKVLLTTGEEYPVSRGRKKKFKATLMERHI